MASIQKKRIKGHVYYYAIQTARVDGKPRVVWQKYLGKVEDIVHRLEAGSTEPVTADVISFGAEAALLEIATRLQLVPTIDRYSGKRQQGVGVGSYMLLAALNRALAHTSKSQLASWYQSTALTRLLPVEPRQLSSQRFWDHMSYLDQEAISRIEAELTTRLADEFQLDLRCLLYDATNFITYIDSTNPSELAQRGHSKAKRSDLKQVSLAMMVSLDFHIPLFHQVYPGHIPDSVQFSSVTEDLVQRYHALKQHCEDITLIYDKGNNARDTQERIDSSPFHFVGSLVPAQHQELLAIPLEQFENLGPPLLGEKAYRTTRHVLGKERTVVVTYNESLFVGQVQGLSQHLTRAVRGLKQLQKRLDAAGQGRKPSLAATQKQVNLLLAPQHLKKLLRVELDFDRRPPRLDYAIDQDAFHEVTSTCFGKSILFTDQSEWSNEDIIRAYRGQSQIEAAFRCMKDPHFVSWSPMFHWTDQKIRVHAFYCVLALTLTSLLHREVSRSGLDLSITRLLQALGGIQEVAVIYPESAHRKNSIVLRKRTPEQQQLFDLLDLGRYTIASR